MRRVAFKSLSTASPFPPAVVNGRRPEAYVLAPDPLNPSRAFHVADEQPNIRLPLDRPHLRIPDSNLVCREEQAPGQAATHDVDKGNRIVLRFDHYQRVLPQLQGACRLCCRPAVAEMEIFAAIVVGTSARNILGL
jgi:hypothetical protein